MEEHRQQIDTLRENELLRQGEIDRLIEERDQSREALSQWKKEQATKEKDYASSYQTKIRERDEQVAQLCAQLRQQQDDRGSSRSLNSIESQTSLDMDRYDLSLFAPPSDQTLLHRSFLAALLILN